MCVFLGLEWCPGRRRWSGLGDDGSDGISVFLRMIHGLKFAPKKRVMIVGRGQVITVIRLHTRASFGMHVLDNGDTYSAPHLVEKFAPNDRTPSRARCDVLYWYLPDRLVTPRLHQANTQPRLVQSPPRPSWSRPSVRSLERDEHAETRDDIGHRNRRDWHLFGCVDLELEHGRA